MHNLLRVVFVWCLNWKKVRGLCAYLSQGAMDLPNGINKRELKEKIQVENRVHLIYGNYWSEISFRAMGHKY